MFGFFAGIVLVETVVHHATVESQCHVAAAYLGVYPVGTLVQCVKVFLSACKLVYLEETLWVGELQHPLDVISFHSAFHKTDAFR